MIRAARNWILVLILIPAAVYGAAKLAVWYTVKDSLAEIRQSLSPFASLQYSKILSPVFGPFGATGIRIKPHIFKETVSVGSALVNIQDPIEKYHFLRATMNDTLPTSFNFSLNQVRVPLEGDIASWLESRAAPGTAIEPETACRTGAALTVKHLKEMDYEELVANLKLDYAYDRRGGGLVVYVSIVMEEMFEITLEGKIPSEEVVFAVDGMDGIPKLSDLSISFHDRSWSTRFNRYCADALGISETEYVKQRTMELRQLLKLFGLEPSEELMRGLKQFTAGTASLTLGLNPRDPLDLEQLPFDDGDTREIIDRLGIEVLVDGKPVQNLGAVAKEAEPDDPGREQPVDETYQSTPLRELHRYIKSQVKIFTDDGKLHEGYLDSVGQEKIVLTRHLVGGSVTFDVSRSNVKEILVLRP